MFQDSALPLLSAIAALAQLLIVAGVILRVMLTRHPPGSAFAWILLTTVLPYVGFLLYLAFGERPIGRLRARRLKVASRLWIDPARQRLTPLGPLPRELVRHRPLLRLAAQLGGLPLSSGSSAVLKPSSCETINAMRQDIDAARHSIDMEFYIWEDGGRIRSISESLIAAARRGVRVRILVDDFGSRAFLRSEARRRLEDEGIEIASALPMTLLRMFGLQRADIRLHRKTVIIDSRIAYTGSFNMIDPHEYAEATVVGAWVDAMVRVEGPAARTLETVWRFDWALQPDGASSDVDPPAENGFTPNAGNAVIATVPSGPSNNGDSNLQLILEAIGRAEHSLTLTTPYFIPTESVVNALLNARLRGARVTLIVPERCDSTASGWAMRRYFDALLDGGIRILLYEGGLLHTKSIAVDDEFAVFGTLNIDNRSLHLNFELMMVIFDKAFVRSLERLHKAYETHCRPVDPQVWKRRPLAKRLQEGLAYLVSPLL